MSITYSVVGGDTFAVVARKTYGDDTGAAAISSANPGIFEPLQVGAVLSIPAMPDAPTNIAQGALTAGVNEVALSIDGRRFRFWDELKITTFLDSFTVVDFSAPFEANAPGFKETFRPFSYKPAAVSVGGVPFFTGTLIDVGPLPRVDRKAMSVSAYSLPGVLNDCTPPASAYPLEFANRNFAQIAKRLIAPFGITLQILADVGPAFESVACEPGRTVFDFLMELSRQRNLLLTSSATGALVVTRAANSGAPVAKFTQGLSPTIEVTPAFNPQEFFSSVTGFESADVSKGGQIYTVKNPFLNGVVRPHNFDVPDSVGGEVKQAVEAKASRMLANAVAYSVPVPTWRDSFSRIWEPGTFVTINAPDAMIYSDYLFLIRSVEFSRNAQSETAILKVVLPGAFSGQFPRVLPWD